MLRGQKLRITVAVLISENAISTQPSWYLPVKNQLDIKVIISERTNQRFYHSTQTTKFFKHRVDT